MIRKWSFPCFAILFLFTRLFDSSSSSALHISGGRNLLQNLKDCPVSFEFLNYTIITSQCKSPTYGERCCPALKELACPYADQINDSTTNCGEVFYSYLLINGKYPSSFIALCQEGKDGISCPETPPPPPSVSADARSCARSTHMVSTLFSLLINLCLLFPGNV